jgi:predicted MPP superfamily phosphohydrolase
MGPGAARRGYPAGVKVRRGRLLLLLPLLAAALAVVAAAHGYVALRLVLDPGLPGPWRGALLCLVAAGFLSLLLAPVAERSLPPRRARWLAWPASLWLGALFLTLVALGASELFFARAGRAALAAVPGAEASSPAPAARAALVGFAVLVAGAAAVRSALAPPRLRRVSVSIPRWPGPLEGFRIAQISDVHIGPILDRRFASAVVARVNALAPDLIAVTGDLVDGPVSRLADEVAPFAGLRARHGTFFVTGNHDHYSGVAGWVERVRALGFRVLRNERVAIERDGAAFDLVGVDDHRGSLVLEDGGEDLDRALAGRDASRPAVLLAHDPTTFRRAAGRVDLQLSGHTHGGQIWPFRYLVRLAVRWVEGLHRARGSALYVSRGTGFWGPPMRLFAPAEITEITLTRGERGEGDDRVE